MKPKLTVFILVLFSLLFIFVLPALAHASLQRAIPEANAVLDVAPVKIELYFTEPLEPSFSEVKVLDAAGVQRDALDSKVDPADPTHLSVSMRSVPNGIYTVVWRALSTVDGQHHRPLQRRTARLVRRCSGLKSGFDVYARDDATRCDRLEL